MRKLLIRVEVLADSSNRKVIWWNLILVVVPAIPVCPWVHLWNLPWIPETKDLIWTHLQLILIDNVFLTFQLCLKCHIKEERHWVWIGPLHLTHPFPGLLHLGMNGDWVTCSWAPQPLTCSWFWASNLSVPRLASFLWAVSCPCCTV